MKIETRLGVPMNTQISICYITAMSCEPVIVVHGGAGAHNMILLDPRYKEAKSAGVKRAARAGWDVLQAGGGAGKAVQAALVVMEDDPFFNAGRLGWERGGCQ